MLFLLSLFKNVGIRWFSCGYVVSVIVVFVIDIGKVLNVVKVSVFLVLDWSYVF